MKKIALWIASLLLCLGCVGCSSSSKQETNKLHILSPSGAPTLALLSVYEEVSKDGEINIVEGTDILSSEFLKEDSEYDVIIAPINLGCQLLEKGSTNFHLAAVLTWGNLYLVENPNVEGSSLAAFGQQAVPGKIFNTVKDSSDIMSQAEVTYYNAVSDVQGQVLANKTHYALMAEPAVTATIAKAKQNNITLNIVGDLQELYQTQMTTSELGYPQAALFVRDSVDVEDLLAKIDTFTNTDALKDDNQIIDLVDSIGAETLGVPSSQVVLQSWERQNIHYRKASEVKDDISAILQQFGITYSDDMLAK